MGGIRRLLGTDYWLCSGKRLLVIKLSIVRHVYGVTEHIGNILVETLCQGFGFSSRSMVPDSRVSPRFIASSL